MVCSAGLDRKDIELMPQATPFGNPVGHPGSSCLLLAREECFTRARCRVEARASGRPEHLAVQPGEISGRITRMTARPKDHCNDSHQYGRQQAKRPSAVARTGLEFRTTNRHYAIRPAGTGQKWTLRDCLRFAHSRPIDRYTNGLCPPASERRRAGLSSAEQVPTRAPQTLRPGATAQAGRVGNRTRI